MPCSVKTNAFFGTRGAESSACCQEIHHEKSLKGEASQRKLVSKQCGKNIGKKALFAMISLQKKVKMRSAMEHKYPDVQFILNALAGS